MYRRIGLAIAIAIGIAGAGPNLSYAQDWRTVTSLRQLKNEQSLDVNVEYGAGKLFIAPGEGNTLYKATLRYDADHFKPVTSYSEGRLRVGIEGGSVKSHNVKAGRLDLALNTHVPVKLDLRFGAGTANIELGGVRLREAHIATGASESRIKVSKLNPEKCSTLKMEVGAADFEASGLGNLNCRNVDLDGGVGDVTLDFNGAWRGNTEVTVDMGLGSLTLRLPRGLGVFIKKHGFLASFDSEGLVKRGGNYYSENYENAGNKISINIDAAFGSIRVVWVTPDGDFRAASR